MAVDSDMSDIFFEKSDTDFNTRSSKLTKTNEKPVQFKLSHFNTKRGEKKRKSLRNKCSLNKTLDDMNGGNTGTDNSETLKSINENDLMESIGKKKRRSKSFIEKSTSDEKFLDEYVEENEHNIVDLLKKRKRLKSETSNAKSPKKVKVETNPLDSFTNDEEKSPTISENNKNEEYSESNTTNTIKTKKILKKPQKSETPKNVKNIDNNNTIINYFSKMSESTIKPNQNEEFPESTNKKLPKRTSVSNFNKSIDLFNFSDSDQEKQETDTGESVPNAEQSKKKVKSNTPRKNKTATNLLEPFSNTKEDQNTNTSNTTRENGSFKDIESHNREPIIRHDESQNKYSEQSSLVCSEKKKRTIKRKTELFSDNSLKVEDADQSLLNDDKYNETENCIDPNESFNTTIEVTNVSSSRIDHTDLSIAIDKYNDTENFTKESISLNATFDETNLTNDSEQFMNLTMEIEESEPPNENDNTTVEPPVKRGRGRPKSTTPKVKEKLPKEAPKRRMSVKSVTPKAKPPKVIKVNLPKELNKRRASIKSLKPGGKLTKESIRGTSFRKIPENRLKNALEMLRDQDHPVYEDKNLSCNAGIHRYWEPRTAMLSDTNMKLKYARLFLLRRDWLNLSKVLCLCTLDTRMKTNYFPLLTKYATLCLAHTDKEQFDKFVQFLIGMSEASNLVMKKCTVNSYATDVEE